MSLVASPVTSPIQIVFTTDNSLLARIARFLGANWTHVVLKFETPDECYQGFNPYSIIEATPRLGVIERPWNEAEYLRWKVYELRSEHIARNTYQRILDYARGNLGKWYAFDRLILVIPRFLRILLSKIFVFRSLSRAQTRWSIILAGERAHFCSSLIDDSFSAAGLDLVKKHSDPWVLPDELAESPCLRAKS